MAEFPKNRTENRGFRTIFPTQCLPCSPPPTGLPGLVSPAGYAQRSDLPDLQEPRNFRKRGEYPKQPAKNTKSRHPRKRPKSTPEVPPQAPAPTESARKVPGKDTPNTRKIPVRVISKNFPGYFPGGVLFQVHVGYFWCTIPNTSRVLLEIGSANICGPGIRRHPWRGSEDCERSNEPPQCAPLERRFFAPIRWFPLVSAGFRWFPLLCLLYLRALLACFALVACFALIACLLCLHCSLRSACFACLLCFALIACLLCLLALL